MTPAFTATAQLPGTPDDNWRTLTDWSLAPQWMPGVERLTGPASPAPGDELTFTARGKDRTGSVAAAVPGAELTLRSVQGGVTADYRYVLRPAGSGTEISLTADVRTAGVMAVFGPLIRRAIRRADSVQLDRLAAVVKGARAQ